MAPRLRREVIAARVGGGVGREDALSFLDAPRPATGPVSA